MQKFHVGPVSKEKVGHVLDDGGKEYAVYMGDKDAFRILDVFDSEKKAQLARTQRDEHYSQMEKIFTRGKTLLLKIGAPKIDTEEMFYTLKKLNVFTPNKARGFLAVSGKMDINGDIRYGVHAGFMFPTRREVAFQYNLVVTEDPMAAKKYANTRQVKKSLKNLVEALTRE